MTASVSSTGTETVTGAHSSRAVAVPSTTALRAKIRQNRDTDLATEPDVDPDTEPDTEPDTGLDICIG
ncbi:hypothetical protein GCM10018783_13880 [Streptomyces griseosporeus]|nr:hypothetical protein GCM10018783_13880 [Streptomyces griseosporeus]